MSRKAPTLIDQQRRVVSAPPRSPRPPAEEKAKRNAEVRLAPEGMRLVRRGLPVVEIPLDDDERFLLGRHDAADVSFDADAVSRLHAVVRPREQGWCFEDYDSSNGSLLLSANGAAPAVVVPHQPTPVFIGDAVELGTPDARVEFITRPAQPDDRVADGPRSAASITFEEKIAIAARTRVPVFLFGPSGCGKTFAARQIHLSSDSPGPFVPLNCARLPQDASALHSELLGHVRGAFTGAIGDRAGRLVLADGGTLFLDEVESLAPIAQGFLLDVLEGSGDLAPLGSSVPLQHAPIFRLISASKIPLGQSGLRDDLCERLAEGHMWRVPTLAERAEDIPALLRRFAHAQGKLLGTSVEIAEEAEAVAQAAEWPGQIRQLKATVSVVAQMAVARAYAEGRRPRRVVLDRVDVERQLAERDEAFGVRSPMRRGVGRGAPDAGVSSAGVQQKADPRALTREQLATLFEDCGGNRSEMARRLGISRNTLARKLSTFALG